MLSSNWSHCPLKLSHGRRNVKVTFRLNSWVVPGKIQVSQSKKQNFEVENWGTETQCYFLVTSVLIKYSYC